MTSTSTKKISLACFGHVKRVADPESGDLTFPRSQFFGHTSEYFRPPAPGLHSDTTWLGDCSGSMGSMGRSPEDGGRLFAQQYATLGKSNSGQTPTHLTYAVFSTKMREVYNGDPADMTQEQINECACAMRPTNMTRFYDSAVEQLAAQGKRIRQAYAALPKATRRLVPLNEFAAAVFATLTDGMDNQSTLCDGAALKRAFARHKLEFGAKILFIAANMSAKNVGASYGIDEDNCLQVGADEEHSRGGFAAATQACLRSASSAVHQHSSPERGQHPPMFSALARASSCGYQESQLYNGAHPAQGRQCTAPIQGHKGNTAWPKGRPQAPVLGINPPPAPPRFGRSNLRRQNAMNPVRNLRQAACGGGGAGPQARAAPSWLGGVQLHQATNPLPLSDDDLSDDSDAPVSPSSTKATGATKKGGN